MCEQGARHFEHIGRVTITKTASDPLRERIRCGWIGRQQHRKAIEIVAVLTYDLFKRIHVCFFAPSRLCVRDACNAEPLQRRYGPTTTVCSASVSFPALSRAVRRIWYAPGVRLSSINACPASAGVPLTLQDRSMIAPSSRSEARP